MTESEGEVSIGRKIGRVVGERVFKPCLERYRKKIENFDTSITVNEDLKQFANRPLIIAANHLAPEGRVDQQSGRSPDAFVIAKAFKDLTGRDITIISKSDDGWKGSGPVGAFQEKTDSFRAGVVEGFGNIPVRKNPGIAFKNRDLIRQAGEVLDKNGCILDFPQGNWYEDFDPEKDTHNGFEILARRSNALVIPTYIRGAHSWDKGQKVDVVFGAHFDPSVMVKGEAVEVWRSTMTELKNQVNSDSLELGD